MLAVFVEKIALAKNCRTDVVHKCRHFNTVQGQGQWNDEDPGLDQNI